MNNTRTVKTMGSNGLESFTTVVLDSIHYESHLMCTNCGPMGLKADTEPNGNRAALTDRSIAHIVAAADDEDPGAEVEFDPNKLSDDMKAHVNKLRVVSCIVAYVLVFIKHIPQCQPNLTYAMMLCNEWYGIVWREYDLPRPSKRKKIKLRMLLHLFCVESAVVEKFMFAESAIDFADMLPDANGHLSPFCIEQLADVIRSLQRCLDQETIHTAWSHSLDHSPATSAHIFQMKTVLSQLHGNELDRHTLVGELPVVGHGVDPNAAPQAPCVNGQPAQTQADTMNDEEEEAMLVAMMDRYDAAQAAAPAQGQPVPPVGAPGPSMAPAPPPPQAPQAPPVPPQALPPPQAPQPPPDNQFADDGRGPIGTNEGDPIVSPMSADGKNSVCHIVNTKRAVHDDLTREECKHMAEELQMQREIRSDLSVRLLSSGKRRSNGTSKSVCDDLVEVFTDAKEKRTKRPMHRLSSTGKHISAHSAAGACMPTVTDVMGRGHDPEFMKDILSGNESKFFSKSSGYHLLGIQPRGWEYECINHEAQLKGPADYDFNWARLTAFNGKGSNSGSKEAQTAAAKAGTAGAGEVVVGQRVGPATAAKGTKSVWTNTAKVIKNLSRSNRTGMFSLMDAQSMTFESARDCLYQIGAQLPENKQRIPLYNHQRRSELKNSSRMLTSNQNFSALSGLPDTIHPNCMYNPPTATQPALTLDPNFANPQGIERPEGSTVATSPYQKRLDHLTERRALPTCIAPDAFERGVSIKECEESNGIYFNKHIASEHSQLVLEIGMYLSNVPGIAGGKYTVVPQSFRTPSAGSGSTEKKVLEEIEEARHEAAQAEQARQAAAANRPQEGASSPSADDDGPDLRTVHMDTDTFTQHIGRSQDEMQEEEAEQDTWGAEPPEVDETEADNRDMHGVEQDVAYPNREGSGIEAQPGASVQSAAQSIDKDAKVESLPYSWDMLAIFLSCKMVETLHNDVQPYVERMRKDYPDVFGNEDPDETLRDLPQICLRFPGLADKDQKLFPLSRQIPLTESRKCDIQKAVSRSCAPRELTEACHSFLQSRSIKYNDPEVQDHEAEKRGLDGNFALDGNLFARSTWVKFTLSALDARGMLTKGEKQRVNDQGLCLRLRVRNARAHAKHHAANKHLSGASLATTQTFQAQARRKRERAAAGIDEEEKAEEYMTASAKRRAKEVELVHEMQNDAMEIDAGC